MKKTLSLVFIIFFIISTLSFPIQAEEKEQWVNYSIDVELDSKQMTLKAKEQVIWTNYSNETVHEIYFHLYPNAFRSPDTTFNKESGGQLRGDRATKESIGSMDITNIQTEDGTSLLKSFQFERPDDQNENDFTVAKVTLPKEVAPRSSVTLNIEFDVKLPKVFARMGYWDDYVMVAQWFPKVAVYEPKGWRHRETAGWNAHQYHGNSEFYANFGTYTVNMTVPKDYIVAATGEYVSEKQNKNGTKTIQHRAENVHDFAWSASPSFVTYEEKIKVQGNNDITVKLYINESNNHLKDRYLDVAKKSLQRFSEWYTTYPYSTLSVVEPIAGAGGAAGMEYPTLVTAWDASKADFGENGLEMVVAHEIGHQFFYGLLASNEFEEAWLDEGFTTYAENQFMISEYGLDPKSFLADRSAINRPESLVLPAWEYHQYGNNVYSRANLVLMELQSRIGDENMAKVMKTYANEWKYKHPTTADFQKVVEKVTDKEWDAFFTDFVYGNKTMDVSVKSIKRNVGTKCYCYNVVLEKSFSFETDVEVKYAFKDGTEKIETWNATTKSNTFEVASSVSQLDYVQLDPNNKLLLDNKLLNNRLKVKEDTSTKINGSGFVSGVLQLLFSWIGW